MSIGILLGCFHFTFKEYQILRTFSIYNGKVCFRFFKNYIASELIRNYQIRSFHQWYKIQFLPLRLLLLGGCVFAMYFNIFIIANSLLFCIFSE